MAKPAVIFGAGGLGGVVRDILRQEGQYEPVGYLDSDGDKRNWIIDTLPVLGGLDAIPALRARGVQHAIVAVGANSARIEIAAALRAVGMNLISAIHPLSSVARSARVAAHAIIGPRVTICVYGHIAEHCVLLAGSIVDHDGVLETGAFLHPAVRLAGGVHVEACATIGIGASVIPGRRIGRCGVVEAGSVVIRDVPEWTTVGGVPAVIREHGRFVSDPQTALASAALSQ